jgi:hypothetical protein
LIVGGLYPNCSVPDTQPSTPNSKSKEVADGFEGGQGWRVAGLGGLRSAFRV